MTTPATIGERVRTLRLASNISQAVGGSKVGGYLNTALANDRGELVLPVIVTGNMAHPSFSPDVEAMAKLRLKNGLNGVLGKQGGALGGILNGVLGGGQKQQQGQQQQQQQQQQNPLNSIFDQFKKKKK